MPGRAVSAGRVADIEDFKETLDSLPRDTAGLGQPAHEFPFDLGPYVFVFGELPDEGSRRARTRQFSFEFDLDGVIGDSHEIEVVRDPQACHDGVHGVPGDCPFIARIIEEGPEHAKCRFQETRGVPCSRN